MIPTFIKPFLWSYDTGKLDVDRDKKRIITNVLNGGTQEAVAWLFRTYSKDDIKNAIIHPLSGEWNKKSLNFWELVLEVKAGNTKRKIPAI